MRTIICLLIAAVSLSAQAPRQSPEPFLPAGIWYGGGTVRPPMVAREPAKERDAWRRELALIKSLGFTSVTSWVDWGGAEPERGQYDFAALDQLLALADDIGLKVIVHAFTDTAPPWLGQRHPDAGYIAGAPAGGDGAGVRGFCPDHPGVRDDRLAFISAVSRAAAIHESFYAIEVQSDAFIARDRTARAPSEFCRCPHTATRFREWAARKYGRAAAVADRALFTAEKLQADLKVIADAARANGSRIVASNSTTGLHQQDYWRMAAVVDQYGTRIYPKGESPAWSPVHLMSILDAVGTAAGKRGWWLGELQARTVNPAEAVNAADVRLWGWAAYSRGARAISFADWPGLDMSANAQSRTDRAEAAGELAGNLARNVRLFAAMRPRPSQVALLDNPDAGRPRTTREFYRIMFEQNIQVDFIDPQELAAGAAANYKVICVASAAPLARSFEQALEAFVRDGGTLIREHNPTLRGSELRIRRLVASAGVKPDIRIEGAAGLVEARFLESADAWLLIALNHAATPQSVTMTFTPDMPEAIWQNLESGAAVHFVQGADGPSYRHTFAARDVMLLVRGKRLR